MQGESRDLPGRPWCYGELTDVPRRCNGESRDLPGRPWCGGELTDVPRRCKVSLETYQVDLGAMVS